MVKMGSKVTDSITGFNGIVTGRAEYLYGCVRLLVEPKGLHDGKPIESFWFDEQRLDVASTAKTGGPGDPPLARPDPV